MTIHYAVFTNHITATHLLWYSAWFAVVGTEKFDLQTTFFKWIVRDFSSGIIPPANGGNIETLSFR